LVPESIVHGQVVGTHVVQLIVEFAAGIVVHYFLVTGHGRYANARGGFMRLSAGWGKATRGGG
jgi:hypothetical protein